MYHKISSLMLNIGKSQTGHREVFVAQPDSVTEKLAGKIFILLEIEGKKNESKKIMEFLIEGVDEYYYQDEKLFLRDKIEGLELENIFEAFLTKLNRSLTDFLLSEKIRIKSNDLNITLGLIFENQLMFSNFGRNKSYLIFRKKDQYEIINVEASAADLPIDDYTSDEEEVRGGEREINFKIFSSVVSGEIPTGSYFFFTNEALPEYLSSREMVLIVTKLPPMVAVEQMKQSLAKVNTFVPFLGIIIKNTIGLSEQEEREEILENLSAQSSISSLNYTEKKTEDMLSPTGLINSNSLKDKIDHFVSAVSKFFKKLISIFKVKDKKVKEAVKSTMREGKKKTELRPPIDIKTKILVVRSGSIFSKYIRSFKNFIVNIFSAVFWSNLLAGSLAKIKAMHPKRKFLFLAIIVLALVLTISLSITARQKRLQEHQEYFDKEIASFQDRYNLINSYLLYDNEEGAKIIIGEISETLDNLQSINDEQEAVLENWQSKLQEKRKIIQRLTIIEEAEKLFDTYDLNPSAEPRNLVLDGQNIYITDPGGKIIYLYNISEDDSSSILINTNEEINLELPFIYNNRINYLQNNGLATVNPEAGQYDFREIAGLSDRKTNALNIYQVNNLLYSLHSADNSILRHSPFPSYSQFTQWLQEEVDLSQAIDMAITGEIWILKSNADILRFYLGQLDREFNLAKVDPPLQSASKLLSDENNLYLLDINNSRLVIYSHTGNFLSQFKFPNLSHIYDLVIDTNENKAYLLVNTALYSFPLD